MNQEPPLFYSSPWFLYIGDPVNAGMTGQKEWLDTYMSRHSDTHRIHVSTDGHDSFLKFACLSRVCPAPWLTRPPCRDVDEGWARGRGDEGAWRLTFACLSVPVGVFGRLLVEGRMVTQRVCKSMRTWHEKKNFRFPSSAFLLSLGTAEYSDDFVSSIE